MGKFLEKYNLPRLNQDEIEKMNGPTTITEVETVIKKNYKKQKSRTRWRHRWILSNIKRRVNTYSSETLSKSSRGRNTAKLILWGHHHLDTKTRQRYHKKRKLQVNFTDEHRCKNPQQNTSKLNLKIYSKDCTPWSSGIYPRDARILQYPQIHQCDTAH